MSCATRWLLSLALMPSLVLAWGETGHRVVCQIAYEELLPEARAEMDRLLALDPDYVNFAESCVFADAPERIRWQDHFMNLPRSTTAITTADCPLAESCVIAAIRNDVLVLRDPASSDADKLLAMKLLGHWVADIHQPMHVSFQDDLGANNINVNLTMEYPNLHAVWDYSIISTNFGDDYLHVVDRLGGQISDAHRMAWQHDSAIEWANESFQITIASKTGYCVRKQGACWYTADNMLLDSGEAWRNQRISNAYLRRHGRVVALRLQQAGVRLGALLNQSLSMQQIQTD